MTNAVKEDGTVQFCVDGIEVKFVAWKHSYVPDYIEAEDIRGFSYDTDDCELVLFSKCIPTTLKGDRILVDYNPKMED